MYAMNFFSFVFRYYWWKSDLFVVQECFQLSINLARYFDGEMMKMKRNYMIAFSFKYRRKENIMMVLHTNSYSFKMIKCHLRHLLNKDKTSSLSTLFYACVWMGELDYDTIHFKVIGGWSHHIKWKMNEKKLTSSREIEGWTHTK
jgi:hypothetical protein